jgi:hypothetical protein
MIKCVPGSLLDDIQKMREIQRELYAMLQREEKRHIMDSDPQFDQMLNEVIDLIDNYIDYDPTPNEPGEPPMTADEMHSAAWKQHQEMHS